MEYAKQVRGSLKRAEITPEMIAAGEDVILQVVGGADLGGFFSASELAKSVYQAMALRDAKGQTEP
jgi:basic membrane lipoprotein Med (substrate-binding protein (PBP1-ABC) superfamily)